MYFYSGKRVWSRKTRALNSLLNRIMSGFYRSWLVLECALWTADIDSTPAAVLRSDLAGDRYQQKDGLAVLPLTAASRFFGDYLYFIALSTCHGSRDRHFHLS